MGATMAPTMANPLNQPKALSCFNMTGLFTAFGQVALGKRNDPLSLLPHPPVLYHPPPPHPPLKPAD